ncbi:hypothetical protein CHS0354_007876 [Potamilus streckersoni]|uniref:Uncharacterized protein n=1 Tax=Potamilus streckersoni TaxID=2493646 RepID=A0AAE0W3V5_9BIVA|nr:hypothetical protein CHS0354_007876 [Potamilus streckersoni]
MTSHCIKRPRELGGGVVVVWITYKEERRDDSIAYKLRSNRGEDGPTRKKDAYMNALRIDRAIIVNMLQCLENLLVQPRRPGPPRGSKRTSCDF